MLTDFMRDAPESVPVFRDTFKGLKSRAPISGGKGDLHMNSGSVRGVQLKLPELYYWIKRLAMQIERLFLQRKSSKHLSPRDRRTLLFFLIER